MILSLSKSIIDWILLRDTPSIVNKVYYQKHKNISFFMIKSKMAEKQKVEPLKSIVVWWWELGGTLCWSAGTVSYVSSPHSGVPSLVNKDTTSPPGDKAAPLALEEQAAIVLRSSLSSLILPTTNHILQGGADIKFNAAE